MITALKVADAPVNPGRVLAEAITLMHGRAAVDDGPTASSAMLTVLVAAADGMPAWSVADTLHVESSWGTLFTGTLSDRRLVEHVDTVELGRCARFQLIGVGQVAALGRRPVGDEPWPQETSTARAERVLTLANVPHVVETASTAVQVNPRDIDARTALDVLTDLAADTAAAVVDLPDGRVMFQPLEARSRPQFYYRWEDFPPEKTWAEFDPAMAWADMDVLSPAAEVPLSLPPSAVAWEPEWISTAAGIINSVRVGYGVPPEGETQADVSASDSGSQTRFGVHHYGNDTQLARVEDATLMASRVISTRAWERWMIGSVDVYADNLTEAEQAQVAALVCGDWVELVDLPQPAPAAAWAGIVEGWTYREWATDDGQRHAGWTLALSDPVASLAVPTWADFTPAFQWDQHSPLITWADLTSLAAIGAA